MRTILSLCREASSISTRPQRDVYFMALSTRFSTGLDQHFLAIHEPVVHQLTGSEGRHLCLPQSVRRFGDRAVSASATLPNRAIAGFSRFPASREMAVNDRKRLIYGAQHFVGTVCSCSNALTLARPRSSVNSTRKGRARAQVVRDLLTRPARA
jgi:hypothetical protein